MTGIIGQDTETSELHGFAMLAPMLMPLAQNLLGKLGAGATGAAPAAAQPYVKTGVDIATKLAMQRMQSELSRIKSQQQTRQIIDLIKSRTQPPPAPRPVAPVYAPPPVYAQRPAPAPASSAQKKNDMLPIIAIGAAGLLLLFMMNK